MEQPTETKTIKFNPKDPEALVGLTLVGAQMSCRKVGYKVIITKANGRWMTGEDKKRAPKHVCIHVENNRVVAVEGENGQILGYSESTSPVPEDNSTSEERG